MPTNYLIAVLATILIFPQLSGAQPIPAGDPDHPGRSIYEASCAICHGNSQFPRAHAFDTLRSMSAGNLTFALREGTMRSQGELLSDEELVSVVSYLAVDGDESNWVASFLCEPNRLNVSVDGPVGFSRVGIDSNNSRHISATDFGLDIEDLSNLELAWAVGFPQTSGLRAAPVIAGSTIFYAVTDLNTVFALDVASGCSKWSYESQTPLRSSLLFDRIDGNGVLIFGDSAGLIHVLDANSGSPVWVESAQASDNQGMITGSPTVHDGKIIVPISGSGILAGGNPRFECCENHGAITALALSTGDVIWEYHTMPSAAYNGQVSSLGVNQKGPSGAPIWSTPTVDSDRNQIYVTTGENTSHPTTMTSDAIIAIDLDTGEENWVFQALPNDMWHFGCLSAGEPGPNCILLDDTNSRDFDFGGSAVLLEGGERDILLAGQKSGDLWAIDPASGQLIWNQKIGEGTPFGGNHWGIATNNELVFLPISDANSFTQNLDAAVPGVYAFDTESGELIWSFLIEPDCGSHRSEHIQNCNSIYGLSATPLSIGDALVVGSLDGRLFILESDAGELMFEFDTAVDFETANGIAATGGAIDAHSIAAGAGMLFIGSGYGQFNQTPGNVLLAFKPRAKD